MATEGADGSRLVPSFRAYFAGTPHAGLQPSHLSGQDKPGLGGGEKPLLISRFAVGLRNFIFGLGVAFTAGKHLDCSLIQQGMPEFALRCL
jgi:hypothetical protein